MNFKTLAFTAALALAAPGMAMAAPQTKPAAGATQPEQVTYDQVHKAVLGMFTQYRSALSNGENAARLTQLPIELAKLPGFEKAYLDAKTAGQDADAKAAADSYAQTAQRVIDLALPLDDMVGSVQQHLGQMFSQMGPIAKKLLAEKDIAAIQAEIVNTLKPLSDANKLVGPLHDNAQSAAQVRADLVAKQFYTEEFGNQVTNFLQGKIGQ